MRKVLRSASSRALSRFRPAAKMAVLLNPGYIQANHQNADGTCAV